jgi:starch synthase
MNGEPQTGFVFGKANAEELAAAMHRAADAYNDKKQWQQLQINAMNMDFSWTKAAEVYSVLYHEVIAKH